jgi:hypothetical protein
MANHALTGCHLFIVPADDPTDLYGVCGQVIENNTMVFVPFVLDLNQWSIETASK